MLVAWRFLYKMNIDKLKMLFNLLLDVNDNDFNSVITRTAQFRVLDSSNDFISNCLTAEKIRVIGGVLAHAITLDDSVDIDKIDRTGGYFNYPQWGCEFFEINRELGGKNEILYDFLFSSNWNNLNNPDAATKKQHLLRLKYVIENKTYYDDGTPKRRGDSMYYMEMPDENICRYSEVS